MSDDLPRSLPPQTKAGSDMVNAFDCARALTIEKQFPGWRKVNARNINAVQDLRAYLEAMEGVAPYQKDKPLKPVKRRK